MVRTKRRLQELYGDKQTEQETNTPAGNEDIIARYRYNLARAAELQSDYPIYRDHPLAFFPKNPRACCWPATWSSAPSGWWWCSGA
jgi:hypothetical protein